MAIATATTAETATTTFADLPLDTIAVIAKHLGLANTWRALDEVVRDQAALAMASRATEQIAELLAEDLLIMHPAIRIGKFGATNDSIGDGDSDNDLSERPSARYRMPQRIVVPDPLDSVVDASSLTADSPFPPLRDAAKACGVAAGRTKRETLSRIECAIAERSRQIRETIETLRRRESDAPSRPVLVNPVPHSLRRRVLEPQKLSATAARERFVLTDRDLRPRADLPCELRQNPYSRSAPPMRLYRISDLRAVAEAKYGGLEHADAQRDKRARSKRRGNGGYGGQTQDAR